MSADSPNFPSLTATATTNTAVALPPAPPSPTHPFAGDPLFTDGVIPPVRPSAAPAASPIGQDDADAGVESRTGDAASALGSSVPPPPPMSTLDSQGDREGDGDGRATVTDPGPATTATLTPGRLASQAPAQDTAENTSTTAVAAATTKLDDTMTVLSVGPDDTEATREAGPTTLPASLTSPGASAFVAPPANHLATASPSLGVTDANATEPRPTRTPIETSAPAPVPTTVGDTDTQAQEDFVEHWGPATGRESGNGNDIGLIGSDTRTRTGGAGTATGLTAPTDIELDSDQGGSPPSGAVRVEQEGVTWWSMPRSTATGAGAGTATAGRDDDLDGVADGPSGTRMTMPTATGTLAPPTTLPSTVGGMTHIADDLINDDPSFSTVALDESQSGVQSATQNPDLGVAANEPVPTPHPTPLPSDIMVLTGSITLTGSAARAAIAAGAAPHVPTGSTVPGAQGSDGSGSGLGSFAIAGIALGGVAVVVITCGVWIKYRRKRDKPGERGDDDYDEDEGKARGGKEFDNAEYDDHTDPFTDNHARARGHKHSRSRSRQDSGFDFIDDPLSATSAQVQRYRRETLGGARDAGENAKWDSYYPAELRDGGAVVSHSGPGPGLDPFDDNNHHGEWSGSARAPAAALDATPEGYHPSMYLHHNRTNSHPEADALRPRGPLGPYEHADHHGETVVEWRAQDPFADADADVDTRQAAQAPYVPRDGVRGTATAASAYDMYNVPPSAYGGTTTALPDPVPEEQDERALGHGHGHGHGRYQSSNAMRYRPDTTYSVDGPGGGAVQTPATGELLPWLTMTSTSEAGEAGEGGDGAEEDAPRTAVTARSGISKGEARTKSKSKSKSKGKSKKTNMGVGRNGYENAPRPELEHRVRPPVQAQVQAWDRGAASSETMQVGNVYPHHHVQHGYGQAAVGPEPEPEHMPVRPMMAQTPAGPRYGWDESVIPNFR